MLLTQSQMKQSFVDNGYFVATDLISKTLVEDMRRDAHLFAITEEVDEQIIMGEVYCGDAWFNYPQLLKYASFKQTTECPAIIEMVESLWDAKCQLSEWILMRIAPGQGGTAWHQDEHPAHANKTKVTLTFYLHDLDSNEGCLRVAPGTQHEQDLLKDRIHQPYPSEVRLDMSNQSAIVQNPCLWHTGSANTAASDQWLFFLDYVLAG
jgi:ectoine hydroxylase-related dioxygenase (phytanoyl-CoA dioxygenase family)